MFPGVHKQMCSVCLVLPSAPVRSLVIGPIPAPVLFYAAAQPPWAEPAHTLKLPQTQVQTLSSMYN